MKRQRIANRKVSSGQKERLEEATKSFREMEKKIAPFVKPRISRAHSTAGRWCNSSDSYRAS